MSKTSLSLNSIVDSIKPSDSQKILDLVNSGLIQIDAEGTVLLWNNWVARHSGIPAEIALGQPLETLLGDELSPTFKAAFQNALACKFPVILSNAFHRSPLPLYPLPLTRQRQERIQQSITITPTITGNRVLCLVQIERKQVKIHSPEEQRLHAHNVALCRLVAHVEQMREEDRKYIAREIHDELGQILAALHLEISMLGSGKETRSTRVESIRYNMAQLLDKAIQGMRSVAVNLRPASLELGLVEALKKLKTEFAKHSNTNCVLQFPEDLINADEDQTVAIFRIVQESLTNVSRHAKASHVAVTLTQNANDLMVAVHDNGQGFDVTSTSKEKTFGLIGMRERVAMLGGNMEIDSMPRQGTVINVRLPIKRGQKILEFAPAQYRHVSPTLLPNPP